MSKTQFEMAQDQHTTQIEAQNTLLAIRLKHILQNFHLITSNKDIFKIERVFEEVL